MTEILYIRNEGYLSLQSLWESRMKFISLFMNDEKHRHCEIQALFSSHPHRHYRVLTPRVLMGRVVYETKELDLIFPLELSWSHFFVQTCHGISAFCSVIDIKHIY